ncbi:MAG: hypothetical protein AAGP08_00425 [Pseudomonadota bacterium]
MERPDGREVFTDSEFKPLKLTVGSSSKTFSVNCNSRGKRKTVVLDQFPSMRVADARSEAQRVYAEFKKNAVIQEPEKTDVTLRDAKDAYDIKAAIKGTKPKTVDEYRRCIEKNLRDWLDVPLRSITGKMVDKRIEQITNHTLPKSVGVYSEKYVRTPTEKAPSSAN